VPFESRIRELSEQLANCKDDTRALELAQELQRLLHERVEQLRTEASSLPLLTKRKNLTARCLVQNVRFLESDLTGSGRRIDFSGTGDER
jgi:hypothetical protein